MPIYNQSWAAGNSTFSTQNVYVTAANGGSDPADPLYPEIIQAEGVSIGIGEGPTGQNVLKWNGTYNDWQGAGVFVALTPWNATEGHVTLKQYFSTSMLAVAYYMPLFWFGASSFNPDIIFGFYLDNVGDPSVGYLDIGGQPGPDPTSAAIDFTPYENTWVDIDICWALGSPGYARVKFNGTTLFETSPATLVTSGAGGTEADTIGLGADGLAGPLTAVVVYDSGCDEVVNSDLDPSESDPCCASGGNPNDPGGGQSGDAPPEDTDVAYQPWTPGCAGGGMVELLATPTDPESWAVL